MVASDGGQWSTLGGEQVSVAIDDLGEFRVNGVRVLAWTSEGPALIVVLEDYLFKEKEEDQKPRQEQERHGGKQEQTTEESTMEEADGGEFPQAKPRKANQRNCTKVTAAASFEIISLLGGQRQTFNLPRRHDLHGNPHCGSWTSAGGSAWHS